MESLFGASMEAYLEDFIRRLDAGEFDGRLSEVLSELSGDQLQAIAEYLANRSRVQRAKEGKPSPELAPAP